MDERDWADHFTREVDNLLIEAERADNPPRPAEYRQALEVAHMLAEIDFSDESKVHGSLKRQLLSLIEREGEVPSEAHGWLSRSYAQLKHRPVALLGVAVLGFILALAVFFPETIAAAAKQAHAAFQVIVLGEDLMVERVESLDELPSHPTADFYGWSLETDIGAFAGNLPVGEDTTIRVYDGLPEAQQRVDFPIQTPTELPAKYTLREIRLSPSGGPASVFLFYRGPGNDIILIQHPLGKQSEEESDQPITIEDGSVTVTKTISSETAVIITDDKVEQVLVDGRLAVWIGAHRLDWEDNSIGYVVGGLDLTLEEAIAIAESLR